MNQTKAWQLWASIPIVTVTVTGTVLYLSNKWVQNSVCK
jgi:hypothetical protein